MVARNGMMACYRLMMFLHMLKLLLLQDFGVLLQVWHMLLHVLEALNIFLHMLEVLIAVL